MVNLDPISLRNLKLKCNLLHKALQYSNFSASDPALRDMVTLVQSNYDMNEPSDVKLKDTFRLVSQYHGFDSWKHLRTHVINKDCFYRKWAPVFVFKWFKDYSSALHYHQRHGGYLLQFWSDFAICGQEYIHRLNLQNYREAWKAVDFNGVEPTDQAAWAEIKRVAVKNYIIINK